MIKVIIFDFDDTLEKYDIAKHYAERRIDRYFSKIYGIKNIAKLLRDIDLFYTIEGKTRKDVSLYRRELWFKDIFHKLKIKPKKDEIKKLVNLYWNSIYEKITLMPNTKNVLRTLKKKFKLAIISDSDGNKTIKTRRLMKLGIIRFFDVVVTGDDIKTTKPDKKFYFMIFKKLKVRPFECVIVGDKPEYDLEVAKKLGLTTVWFVYGDWAKREKRKHFKYVDFKINSLKELIKLFN